MDGAASGFSAVEDVLAAALSADANAAGSAWEDAWLSAGALRTRAEGARDAAITQLREIPPSEVERMLELEQDLAAVVASHDARWQTIVDGIAEAGRRVAANGAHEPPPERPVSAIAVSAVAPAPPPHAPAAGGGVVPVPVGAPDRAIAVVAAVAAPPPVKAVTSRSPQHRTERQQPISPAATIHPASTAAEPIARARPELPAKPTARRRRTAIVAAMLVSFVVVGGSVLVRAIGQLRTDAEMATNRDAGLPAVVGGVTSPSASRAVQEPSSSPASPTETGAVPAVSLDFDMHRIGSLDVDELPISRLVGTPEVAAFPSPFDRSLRLTGPAAGVCLERPGTVSPVASMAFDLHLGEAGSAGSLTVAGLSAAGAGPASGLTIDLAAFGELDRDAWYRVIVSSTGASGRVTVRTLDDDRHVLDAELVGDEALAPTSRVEACLSSSALPTDASVFVDNLRLDG